jgi:WD40 repeat protein
VDADPDPGSGQVRPEPGDQGAVTVNIADSVVQIGSNNIQNIIYTSLHTRRGLMKIAAVCAAAGTIGSGAYWALSGQAPSSRTNAAAPGRAAVPLGLPLTGLGAVYTVAFSPDGSALAAGGSDWETSLWDLTHPARPVLFCRPFGYDDIVYSVVFRPGGEILAAGRADGTVQLWSVTDPARPKALGPFIYASEGATYSVAFSPDGRIMAVGGTDTQVWLWDLTDPADPVNLGSFGGQDIMFNGQGDTVLTVAFSPSGQTLASGNTGSAVHLWDVTSPAKPVLLGQPLIGFPGYVYSVAFSPDGHVLACGSADIIELWDVTDPAHPAALGQPSVDTNAVLSVAFSPDGRTLASGSADNKVRLWDVTDAAHPVLLGQPLTGHSSYVYAVAFSPDGHILASGSNDETIKLWSINLPAGCEGARWALIRIRVASRSCRSLITRPR